MNGIPMDAQNYEELDAELDILDGKYRELFIDNDVEFSYIGFDSDKAKDEFVSRVKKFASKLKASVDETKYVIVDDTDSY
ncbi:hypothetical protein [Periweissella cryptocerci]|uniref:hypothetical protein n=1 Tax=Periweissella cryptocerci TaxID=2506420 RepID=UPI001404B9B8|nr:hypothetical protein [Periweissella cryptocerci]